MPRDGERIKMISPSSLTLEWMARVSAKHRKADKILIEKVIRALLLLEGLAGSGLSFVFKGGTAVMLLQDTPKRFSIDIDIIVPEKADLNDLFSGFIKEKGFSRVELQNRETEPEIDKSHYKFYYEPVHKSNLSEDGILLDVLGEASNYRKIVPVKIDSPFVKQDGPPAKINIPSKEDILADKLTAFAPNTTGVPYMKGGFSRAMEIVKQLFDIGNLFDDVHDMSVIRETFGKIARTEMRYRQLAGDVNLVLEDMFQTALCISTKGKAGRGDLSALQEGVSQIRAYIFSELYHIEKAIVHASRIAYLSKLIEAKESAIVRFEGPEQVLEWTIGRPFNTKLNKLKRTNPEAFFYWYQSFLLAKKQGQHS